MVLDSPWGPLVGQESGSTGHPDPRGPPTNHQQTKPNQPNPPTNKPTNPATNNQPTNTTNTPTNTSHHEPNKPSQPINKTTHPRLDRATNHQHCLAGQEWAQETAVTKYSSSSANTCFQVQQLKCNSHLFSATLKNAATNQTQLTSRPCPLHKKKVLGCGICLARCRARSFHLCSCMPVGLHMKATSNQIANCLD